MKFSFWKICNMSPIAIGLFVSVWLSVSVTIIRTGRTIVKIKNVKMIFVDFYIHHRIA